MPVQRSLNVSPYYDDFDESKNFHRVLFKAGTPVQARELTQSQTILQDQLEKFASHFMTDGDVVVPGEFSLINPAPYVRLSQLTLGAEAEDFIGYKVTGVSSGVVAKVIHATNKSEEADATLYVLYESSGDDKENEKFVEGETLESSTPNRFTAVVGINEISRPVTSRPMGAGTLFQVTNGSYFINGFIVRCETEIVVVDPYTTRPNKEVGFVVSESFVTSTEDSSLLDNSQGASNFAAPGADRLKITLRLKVRDPGDSDPNFIMLANIVQGNVTRGADETVKWQWLYDILARRTNDESGDYIARDFPLIKMEYYNTEDIEGLYDADLNGLYPPVPGSGETERISLADADDTYVLKVDPGKAYVQGYECGFKSHVYVYGKKPRQVTFETNNIIKMTEGDYFPVTHVNSHPDIQTINATQSTEALNAIQAYRMYNDGYLGEHDFNMGNRPLETFHVICNGPIGGIESLNHETIYKGTNSAVVTSPNFDVVRGVSIDGGASIVKHVVKIEPVPSGVMHARYFTKGSTLATPEYTYDKNSTYKMGVVTSTYFTEFVIVPDILTINEPWVRGDLLYGEISGAIGTIEEGSTDQVLILSSIIGKFMPGEGVYQTRKSAKIIRDGEVTGFAFLDGQDDLSNVKAIKVETLGSTEHLIEGNHFIFDGYNLIPTEEGRLFLRRFPFLQDDEDDTVMDYKCTALEGDFTNIPSMTPIAEGYAVVPTLKISNTITKTKSFYSTLSLNGTDEFSADVSGRNNDESELTLLANGNLFTGNVDSNVLECMTLAGDASDQLVSGDIIVFSDELNNEIRKMVHFVTKPFAFNGQRNSCKIFLTTTLEKTITNFQIERLRLRAGGFKSDSLIYDLPQDVTASIETDPLNTRISYTIFRQFVLDINIGAKELQCITSKANETFLPDVNLATACIMKMPGNTQEEGKFIKLIDDISLEDNNRKITFGTDYEFAAVASVKVIAPVFVENAQAKRKEIQRDVVVVIPHAEAAAYPIISLGYADVVRVKSITMNGNDVTDRYEFDNGQRSNLYEISRLIRRNGGDPSGDLVVTMDYFKHVNEGDFFSVDSYTSGADFTYRDIPRFSGTDAHTDERVYTELRDAIDFRPIVNTVGPDSSVIATITDGRDRQSAMNFFDSINGGNSHLPRFPAPNSFFKCDIQYYLPKVDSLFLDKSGTLTILEGDSDKTPVKPPDLATGLRLYDIELPAYTFNIKDVRVKKYNYKRFQMKDIAGIERRIDRLEDLVTLSILEQTAVNFNVRDAVTGLDRFKNGIVVDPFEDHSRGDISSQYRNSIDPASSTLRAAHFTEQVGLEEEYQADDVRLFKNYRNHNGIVTLEYDDAQFLRNPFATRFINLQPYTVFTYDGELNLIPEIDTWTDVRRRPDLVIEDNSLFNAMQGLTTAMQRAGLGTHWGSWRVTGVNRSSNSNTEIRRVGTGLNDGNAALANQVGAPITGDSRGNRAPIRVTTTTTTTTINERRDEFQNIINVNTARVDRTSYGDRVTDVQVARTMKSVPVVFQAYRLKPNTRYYIFFDGVEISRWCSPDTPTIGSDDLLRYSGLGGSTNAGFGLPLISDDVGTVTGIMLIPNGRPPVEGGRYISFDRISYETSGPTRSFSTGTRSVRITSSPSDETDLDLVEGFADATFTASGVLIDKQETIVGTRIPRFSNSTISTGRSETRSSSSTSSRVTSANYFDPIAQTFIVDDVQHPDGVFVTELETFFKTKDPTQGVEAYLTTTEGSVPTTTIMPNSIVNLNSDTILRMTCILGGTAVNQTSIREGVSVRGETSNATGIVKSAVVFSSATSNPSQNVDNHVYDLVLTNYNGTFLPGEVLINQDPQSIAARDGSQFRIVQDELRLTRIDVTSLGVGYGATIGASGDIDGFDDQFIQLICSGPQLPGGVSATATGRVSQEGRLFDVRLLDPGSGYTEIPTVTVIDLGLHPTIKGAGAGFEVRVKPHEKAVIMGVSTSADASAGTKFRFKNPIFLMPGETYAFVLKSPNSVEYTAYCSKLGENLLNTQTRVVEQPSLGSLFKSQNGGLWTEDQTQDIKFEMKRAEFSTDFEARLHLQNQPIGQEFVDLDPIETNGNVGTGTAFGDNPSIVRVYHGNHGLHPGDLTEIRGVVGDIGGIDGTLFNNVHTVLHSHFDYFTIQMPMDATSAERGGGTIVSLTPSRPYEVMNLYTGAMIFPGASFKTEVTTAYGQGISGYNDAVVYTRSVPINVQLTDDVYFEDPMVIGNYLNEGKFSGPTLLGGRRSFEMDVKLRTDSSKISPVIDLQRTAVTCTRNLVENFPPTHPIYGPITSTVTFDSTFDAAQVAEKLEFDGTSAQVVKALPNINKLVLRGNSIPTKTSTVSGSLADLGIATVSKADSGNYWNDETLPNGSSYAKWSSRMFIFDNACDGIELRLTSVFYNVTNIRAYYRLKAVGFDGEFGDLSWAPFNPTQSVETNNEFGQTTTLFVPGLSDNADKIEARTYSNVNPFMVESHEWESLTFSAQNLARFDGIAIKIVMTSDNPCQTPLIDDFMMICSE